MKRMLLLGLLLTACATVNQPEGSTAGCQRVTLSQTLPTDTLLILGQRAVRLWEYNPAFAQTGSITLAICPGTVAEWDAVFFIRDTSQASQSR